MKRHLSILAMLLSIPAFSQSPAGANQRFNFHFQQTVVTQYQPGVKALYSGTNSFSTKEEAQTSVTSTFFIGVKLGKYTEVYFNPELAGGSGLSKATGIAGFPNGETFRVGNPKPTVYIGRAYIRHYISLSKETETVINGINQLGGQRPVKYLSVVAGKFSLADFFDGNTYSHDPRTQFLNWSLMSNGAYDYAANVRGYTQGIMLEYVSPAFSVRYAAAQVPAEANGARLDKNIGQALSHQVEIEKPFGNSRLRLLGFINKADMGKYTLATQMQMPDITATRMYGRTKAGFGVNFEHKFSDDLGLFARYSLNDGHNETWAFTEIDRSLSAGIALQGSKWHRPEDTFGLAVVSNGISKDHQAYLNAGGVGFMVGDGKLNYGSEDIIEVYYRYYLHEDHFWISPDYQFIMHPAYNRDRGPANVVGARVHVEF
ncbi:carbohydrate porin [Emticicia sp. TH156]|uniref:carbohydrate porin n=1 Tax=Emticicia sp. TH156 TaxID=2067454 RepID=UPI000C786799|nr:carbohydrate porin [Emticicia sp. TH156]PLK43545.1 carbohydrate porin [Emticicia sp. TH156]